MKRDIDGCLGRSVTGREAVHIGENRLQLERIIELTHIHLLQKGRNCFHTLTEVRWHRRFTISRISFIINTDLNSRSSLSGI